MNISDVLDKKAVIPNLKSQSKNEIIKELAEGLSSVVPNLNNEKLVESLLEREKLCSTAVDSGIAIPHAKLSGISNIVAQFGKSAQGIPFDSLDGKPTQLFFMIIAPENATGSHIHLLARISKIFKNPELRAKLIKSNNGDEIFELLMREDEKY